jgi:hypothetical protein
MQTHPARRRARRAPGQIIRFYPTSTNRPAKWRIKDAAIGLDTEATTLDRAMLLLQAHDVLAGIERNYHDVRAMADRDAVTRFSDLALQSDAAFVRKQAQRMTPTGRTIRLVWC